MPARRGDSTNKPGGDLFVESVRIQGVNMKNIIAVLLLFICAASLVGCKGSSVPIQQTPAAEPGISGPNPQVPERSQGDESPAMPPSDTVQISGTVVYKDLEGGFWAIDAGDGSRYDPINLPEAFRKDGMKVQIKARLEPDAMSAHMYGSIIHILSIAEQ